MRYVCERAEGSVEIFNGISSLIIHDYPLLSKELRFRVCGSVFLLENP